VLPLHELHGEEDLVLVGVELVERHQVGVDHVGERAELALEAGHAVRARLLQRLERDRAAALAVDRLVHHAHPARAQLAVDDEATAAE
jgi:hypothetical protein